MANFLDALLGMSMGAASGGQTNAAFKEVQDSNRRQTLLEQIQAAGGVNSQQGQVLAQQNPQLNQELQAADRGQFAAQQNQQAANQANEATALSKTATNQSLSAAARQRALMELIAIDPDKANNIMASMGINSEEQKAQVMPVLQGILDAPKGKRKGVILDAITSLKGVKGMDNIVSAISDLNGFEYEDGNSKIESIIASAMPRRDLLDKIKNKQGLSGGKQSAGLSELKAKLEMAGYKPGTEGYKDAVKQNLGTIAKAGSLTKDERVYLDDSAEGIGESMGRVKELESEGAGRAAETTDITKTINHNAQQAARTIPKLQVVLDQLKNVETGKYEAIGNALGAWIPGVDVTNTQQLMASLNQMAFEELSKFSGATSEKELEFAKNTTAQMGNTVEANRIILTHAIEALNRAIDEKSQFDGFREGGGKAGDFLYNMQQSPGKKKKEADKGQDEQPQAGFSDQQKARLEELRRRKAERGG